MTVNGVTVSKKEFRDLSGYVMQGIVRTSHCAKYLQSSAWVQFIDCISLSSHFLSVTIFRGGFNWK